MSTMMITVALAFVTLTIAQPLNPPRSNAALGRMFGSLMLPLSPPITYTAYKGNGSVADGWPDQSEWVEFRSMWFSNQHALINKICDNSAAESAALYNAISTVSNETTVDPRFILAVIMEESRGCVRVPTTSYAVANPGVMQSYQGKGTCVGTTPCPESEIVQMVKDGTDCNDAGVDLKDLLVKAGTDDVSRYYVAARMYNSGPNSVGADGELSEGGSNACYASDIANRLRGYLGGSCGVSSG